MAKAQWNGVVLAQSDDYEKVEGNIYFPPESLNREYFRDSDTTTRCFWKGMANYYDLVVNGKVNSDAAWYYPSPSRLAKKIQNHVAFWKGVEVSV